MQTKKDAEIVGWIGRIGAAGAEHVMGRFTMGQSWAYDAVRTGSLPCIRVGRHIRFTRGMLEEWLKDRYRA
jgi:excisionase family DNA binding protein